MEYPRQGKRKVACFRLGVSRRAPINKSKHGNVFLIICRLACICERGGRGWSAPQSAKLDISISQRAGWVKLGPSQPDDECAPNANAITWLSLCSTVDELLSFNRLAPTNVPGCVLSRHCTRSRQVERCQSSEQHSPGSALNWVLSLISSSLFCSQVASIVWKSTANLKNSALLPETCTRLNEYTSLCDRQIP